MTAIARQIYLLAHNSVVFVLSPFVSLKPMEPQICKIYLAFTNSVVISIISTIFCVAVGSMAAYAGQIQYRPKFGNIMIFVLLIVGVIVATTYAGVPWWMSSAVALALFFFLHGRLAAISRCRSAMATFSSG